MKYSVKLFLFFILTSFASNEVSAQYFPSKSYPKNYFRNPLGIPIQLSGNFGELRTNHFHMGLDIRTAQRENLPVYAAAEGYVSRIIIERFGYGRAIIITHPNGYSTLYAHLNDFYKELNDHVKDIQYRDEIWEHDFTLPPGLFPVTKGQFIAYSGNTGGSEGPHLHFEIRDTRTDKNVNPLHFNFNIPDKTPPNIYGLYWYDRRLSIYQTTPKRIAIKGSKENYKTIDSVISISSPTFSFGMSAEDKTDKSFKFGIYQAELYVDDSLRVAFQLDNFVYDDSRYMNGSIDYKTKYTGGTYIQHLSRLPGNDSPIFFRGDNGVINISDTLMHKIEVYVKDVAGSTSNIQFKVRLDSNFAQAKAASYTSLIVPGKENLISADGIEVTFSDQSFYDTVPFQLLSQQSTTSRAVSPLFSLHNYTVPVHDSFTVRIKTSQTLPAETKEHVVMQLISNRKKVAAKGNWNSDWVEAKFWDLGKVQLIIDTIPPTLSAVGWKNGSKLNKATAIAFFADDDAGELKSFRAELDGKWLMFSRKSDYFIHKFDEHTTPGAHQLKVFVTDEADNVTTRVYSFTR